MRHVVRAAICLGLAASTVLVAVIVTVGVVLPIVWSRNPRRRKAAGAILDHLLDQTRQITAALRRQEQHQPTRSTGSDAWTVTEHPSATGDHERDATSSVGAIAGRTRR